mmetsp:Transcript_7602/g.18614  ORF Transcript_7602/g.18614 Transcript_7602/m.18614 type:complete len:92 (-) Transcript_7602:193-468(-)
MKEKRQADRTFEERSISLSTDHLGSACKKHHFVATEQNTAVCLCHFHIPPQTTRIRNVSRSHALYVWDSFITPTNMFGNQNSHNVTRDFYD